MVLDQPQPFHLFIGEVHRTGVAPERPLHEVVVHPIGKGRQMIGIAHLKADDRHQIGQLAQRAALDLAGLLNGIAVPEPLDGDALGLELFIERFEPGNGHGPVLVALVVKNPQGDDFIPVFRDEVAQGLYGALRVGLLLHVEAREEHRVQIDIVDDLIVVAADVFHVFYRAGISAVPYPLYLCQ